MNITKTFSAVLCVLLGMGALQAQYYDQEIDFQGLNYRSMESAKMVTEIPGSNEAYAVGSVLECSTCTPYDVSVTSFDPSGNVNWSTQFGQTGTSEIANATVIGDFNDRIIVVGQIDNRDALIAAIEVPSGAMIWSQRIGDFTPGITESLNTVISLNPGSGQYLAMGWATDASGQQLIYSVGFDDNGGINWMRTMDDYQGIYQAMIPTNITLSGSSSSPTPQVVGIARTGSQQKLFVGRVDPTNGLMYWFRTLDLHDGTNYAVLQAGDICATSSNSLALAFTAYNILGSTGTNSLVCYMPLNFSYVPPSGVAYTYNTTWSSGGTHDYHFGVGIYDDNGDLDIGVRFSDVGGSTWDGVPGFLEIDPSGTVLSSTAYNSHSPYFETGMVRRDDGYYIKSRRESDNFNLNAIDFSGSTGTSCDWTPNWIVNKVKVLNEADELIPAYHGTDLNHPMNDQSTSGINYTCNGGSSSFKKGVVGIEDVLTTSGVYPTLVDESSIVSITTDDFSGQDVAITVTNALGQMVYTNNTNAKEGDVLNIEAAHLSMGINIITVTDAMGNQLINSRVVKQ